MICKACGRITHFDYFVPDNIWKAVIPEVLQNRVVCLECFDQYAKQVNIDYSDSIDELVFAGDRASFIFCTVSSFPVKCR